MGIKFNQIPGKPIVVFTVDDAPEGNNPRQMGEAITSLLDSTPGTLYRVFDFSNITPNFSNMMIGMGSDPLRGHPRIKDILVGTAAMVQFAAGAAKQQQYGGVEVKVYPTVDEALAVIEAELAE